MTGLDHAADRSAPTPAARRIRPRRDLLRNGLLTLLLGSVTLFGSLYLLTVPLGTADIVVAGQVVVTIVALACFFLYRSAHVTVDRSTVTARGLTGRRTVIDRADIATVVIVATYRWNASDTTPRLLVRDVAGTRLLRLHGAFWGESSMRELTSLIGVGMQPNPGPMTGRDLFRTYPGSSYWFEAKPVLGVAAISTIVVASLAIMVGLMAVTDVSLAWMP
ncbi:hypothetical protein [Marisediminicola sp. LYQ85]|uniref:hypothetical protein n=1 Tax=Marisediminicola sp. LYQ85 TaxID=3391062 RepID=UPI0039834EBF